MYKTRWRALLGGMTFLVITLVWLYRLLFWFPINIAGQPIGQPVSFLCFSIFAALTVISFQELTRED